MLIGTRARARGEAASTGGSSRAARGARALPRLRQADRARATRTSRRRGSRSSRSRTGTGHWDVARPAARARRSCSRSSLLAARLRRRFPAVVARRGACSSLRLDADVARSRRRSASRTSPTRSASSLRAPLDWVDRDTRRRAAYLPRPGDQQDPNGILLTRVLEPLAASTSTASTARRPGRARPARPRSSRADGPPLAHAADSRYVLADNGVDAPGARCRQLQGPLRLYRKDGPWRLLDAEQQVYERRLGARLVDVHVLQAGPARDARGDALADGLQRRRAPGQATVEVEHREDRPERRAGRRRGGSTR